MSCHFTISKWRLKFPIFLAPWLFLVPVEKCWDWGVLIAAFGMAVRICAAGYLGRPKEKELVTAGPYAYLRHPLYLGTFFMIAGLSAATGRPEVVIVLIMFSVPLYVYSVHMEELKLQRRFGPVFCRYRAEVRAFFPRYRRRTEQSSGFSWTKVWKRHEYQSLIILLAVFAAIHGNEYMWEYFAK
ncbi:MAG: methyltransferase family protein [Candidatus Binatia bacterium]